MKVNLPDFSQDGYKSSDDIVEIDKWDTWNCDMTLAKIIYPLLIEYKETTHSYSYVDNEDVPFELRCISDNDRIPGQGELFPLNDSEDADLKKWNYVLDKMIESFGLLANDWESDYYEQLDELQDIRVTLAEIRAIEERIQEGITLFGKYYRGIWD